jgi:hypothetical protein
MSAAGAPLRVAKAAALYFVLVFLVGLALGPIRVVWIEPALGQTLAVLLEAPLLMAAMAIAAPRVVRWAALGGEGWFSHLCVGVAALILQQIADLSVGFGLRGMSLDQQLAYFATAPGYIYAFTLLAFALAPLAAFRRRRPA